MPARRSGTRSRGCCLRSSRSLEIVRLESLEARSWPRPAVTVGNFDGVHRGHHALVAQAVADSRASGGTAVVLAFDPHPSHVLAPERAPATPMHLAHKAQPLAPPVRVPLGVA